MLKKIQQFDRCPSNWWMMIEYGGLLISNIMLLIMFINSIDESKWYNIIFSILLIYCMVSNLIFLLMCICKKYLIWSVHKIMLNQIIALIVNLIAASIILLNINDWSSVLVLFFIIEIVVKECLCFILHRRYKCTLFRISNIYGLYLWYYYFKHGGIDFGFMPHRSKDGQMGPNLQT